MKVKLIAKTPNVLDVVYTGARTCYNAGSPVDMWFDVCNIPTDKKKNLIDKVFKSGHLSTAEHAYFTFAIEGISRACSHQLVRHRHASYCLAGDTIIKQRSHGESRTIKELYESAPQYNKSRRIRCINEATRELQYDPIKEIVYSGKKPVYEVTTNFGYKIKSTMQHRFFTQDGWKKLEELSIGDTVYVNGVVAYQDKDWLNNQYNILNKSQEEIGEICGVSKHTVRKWIRKHNLQKELGSWSVGREPANKGRTKNDYEPMLKVSQKMIGNTNYHILHGEDNLMWRGDNVGISGGYTRTHKLNKKTGICSNCGSTGYTELHHIDKNPTNSNNSNIMELCQKCHKAIHKKEIKEVVIPNTIISIEYIGIVDTYDISMAGDNHNFIANGFVVHNSQQSQRYVEIKEDQDSLGNMFTDEYNTNNLKDSDIYKTLDKYFVDINKLTDINGYYYALDNYLESTKNGEKAEDARRFLPNGTKTNLVVSMNLRELMHLCNERLCTRAQSEIRQLVKEMVKQVVKDEEWLKPYLVPKCEQHGICFEHKSCGRKPTLEELKQKWHDMGYEDGYDDGKNS